MAVIQIPSKNIFSIDNPKIIDNIIDKIEIETNDCQVVTDYHTIVDNEIFDVNVEKTNRTTAEHCQLPFITGTNYYLAAQYASLECGYSTVTLRFPKSQVFKRVKNVYDGTDKNGNNNIGYTVNYKETPYKVKANGTIILNTATKTASIERVSITNLVDGEIERGSGIISDDNPVEYTEEAEFEYIQGSGKTITLKTTCETPNLSTVPSAKIVDKGEEYEITLTILTAKNEYYVRYGGGYNWVDWQNDQVVYLEMNGNGVRYEPNAVDITIYGDTIQLDISKLLSYVGKKNGENVFSVDTNELVQATNTPLLEKYEKVLEAYKDGKETATIRCSIDNYYTAKKDKAISIEPNSIAFSENVGGTATGALLFSASGSFFIGVGKIRNLQIKTLVGETSTVSYNELTGEISWRIRGRRNQEVSATVTGIIELPSGLPMYFHLRDKVIPYIYSAKGVDVPMSQYKNGTPKVFEVLSSKIYYDGAVWQELVLVESKE